MKKTPLLCTGHSRPVPFFSYSDLLDDGSFFISSSCLDGKPMLRDGKTGDWIGTFLGHKGAVWSSQINPAGTVVATASADYTAKVWNAISGEEVQSFTHNCVVKTSEFFGSSKLVTGGMDKTLRVYDLEKPEEEPTCKVVGDNLKRILCPSSSPTLSLCLTSSGNVVVWDLRSMEKVQELTGSCSNLGLTADKKKLVTVGSGQIMVWDAATFQQENVLTVPNSVVCASLDSGGSSPSLMVTGGSDNWIRVFDYASKKEVEVIKGHHGPVNCVSYAPDGQTYASGSDDGTIRIWLAKETAAYGLWELGDPSSSSSSSSSSSPAFQSESAERRRRPSDHNPKRSPNRSNSSSHKNLAFHNNGKSRGGWGDNASRGEGGSK